MGVPIHHSPAYIQATLESRFRAKFLYPSSDWSTAGLPYQTRAQTKPDPDHFPWLKTVWRREWHV